MTMRRGRQHSCWEKCVPAAVEAPFSPLFISKEEGLFSTCFHKKGVSLFVPTPVHICDRGGGIGNQHLGVAKINAEENYKSSGME